MNELTDEVRDWLRSRRDVVLVTLRGDGAPQSSNVLTTFDGECFRVSVTAGRAKTRNLQRDPRAIVHVLGEDFWQYAAVTCTAEIGPVTETAGDDAGRALLDTYEAIAGKPHPEPDEFLAEQVAQRRLVLTLRPVSVAGYGG